MGLGNYIGEFSLWREYMRLKVRFDIRQPLKIGKKIRRMGVNGVW